MEHLNYIGSKKTLFKTIFYIIQQQIPNYENLSFSDLFAGSGIMSYNINNYVNKVISNDLEYYSYIILYAILKSNYSSKLKKIINELNNLKPIEGLIYNNYAKERMFFTQENAQKADAIRKEIETLKTNENINKKEYMFLLSSLIISLDKYANTSSVYGAYLKQYKTSALKQLSIKPIHKIKHQKNENKVYNKKAEELTNLEHNIVYLDPPYNHRQYASNYSPLNYISHYDNNIELTGKTGLIKDYNKSDFSSKTKVKDTFKNLIENLNCSYILLSYNNEGIMKFDFIKEVLMNKGKVILYKIKYNKFKSNSNVKNKQVIEYVWLVDVNKQKNYEEVDLDLIK